MRHLRCHSCALICFVVKCYIMILCLYCPFKDTWIWFYGLWEELNIFWIQGNFSVFIGFTVLTVFESKKYDKWKALVRWQGCNPCTGRWLTFAPGLVKSALELEAPHPASTSTLAVAIVEASSRTQPSFSFVLAVYATRYIASTWGVPGPSAPLCLSASDRYASGYVPTTLNYPCSWIHHRKFLSNPNPNLALCFLLWVY